MRRSIVIFRMKLLQATVPSASRGAVQERSCTMALFPQVGSPRHLQILGMASLPSLPFEKPPAALCLVRLSAIGDTCHTVPVVRAIQKAWPATRITWIIGKTEHSLMRGLHGVEL